MQINISPNERDILEDALTWYVSAKEWQSRSRLASDRIREESTYQAQTADTLLARMRRT